MLDGYVTRPSAERDYGVVLRDDLSVDEDATRLPGQSPPSSASRHWPVVLPGDGARFSRSGRASCGWMRVSDSDARSR